MPTKFKGLECILTESIYSPQLCSPSFSFCSPLILTSSLRKVLCLIVVILFNNLLQVWRHMVLLELDCLIKYYPLHQAMTVLHSSFKIKFVLHSIGHTYKVFNCFTGSRSKAECIGMPTRFRKNFCKIHLFLLLLCFLCFLFLLLSNPCNWK